MATNAKYKLGLIGSILLFLSGFQTQVIRISLGQNPWMSNKHNEAEKEVSLPHLDITIKDLPYPQLIRKDRPLLILHAGPPKTATTTIQDSLFKFREDLKADNFWFAGRHRQQYFPQAMDKLMNMKCQRRLARLNSTDYTSVSCWNEFVTELQQLYDAKTNVIISDECFGEEWKKQWSVGGEPGRIHWPAAIEAFKDWDVHVILSYRRQFDWLVSVKAQYDFMGSIWRIWLAPQKGNNIESIWSKLEKFMQNSDNNTAPDVGHYKNVEIMYNQFRKFFPNTHVWNMAAKQVPWDTEIVTAFVCGILPNANRTCEKAKQQKPTASNKAQDYDLKRLVGHVGLTGLINTKDNDRGAFTKNFENYLKEQGIESSKMLPLTCPTNEELERYLESSLQQEERLLPDFYRTQEGEIAHRRKFWEAVENKKFCSINLDKAVQDKTLKDFFVQYS